jgi:hypothetical protein
MLLRRPDKRARGAAWHAQVALGIHAPFIDWREENLHADPLEAGAVAVEHSEALRASLMPLAAERLPGDVLETAGEALHALIPLCRLRSSWRAHVAAEHQTWPATVPPGHAEAYLATCREYPEPSTVGSWEDAVVAQDAVLAVVAPLIRLHAALVSISGRHLGKPVYPPGLGPPDHATPGSTGRR